MKKIFTEHLPKRGKLIDWKNCVGLKVPFIYDDIEGEIEIIKYVVLDKSRLIIKYKDRIFEDKPISIGDMKKCSLGYYLNLRTNEFKFEIGQHLKDEKRDLIIIDRKCKTKDMGYQKYNKKYYKYKCNICGFNCEDYYRNGTYEESLWTEEIHLNDGGCSCCAGRVAVLGINTIYDIEPWMMKLGVSEEDAKKYTKGSHEEVKVVCPDCKREKKAKIYNIFNKKTIFCSCSDGVSYPERFMGSVLRQLNLSFETQITNKNLDWCDKYRYDFYIPSLNMIIEVHGLQHYEDAKGFKRTLQEEQENDRLKKQLALNNGIDYYVVIDCRYSKLEWIKNSIFKSKLNQLFDLSKIDWEKTERFALPNLIKEVCNYWNNKEEWETVKTIAKNNVWGIKGDRTIREYLKKGCELNWCYYNPSEEYLKGVKKPNRCGKKVEVFKDGESFGVFASASEVERQSEELFKIKLNQVGISKSCRENKPYKGFKFKYIINK